MLCYKCFLVYALNYFDLSIYISLLRSFAGFNIYVFNLLVFVIFTNLTGTGWIFKNVTNNDSNVINFTISDVI